jgi:hypothetical protein
MANQQSIGNVISLSHRHRRVRGGRRTRPAPCLAVDVWSRDTSHNPAERSATVAGLRSSVTLSNATSHAIFRPTVFRPNDTGHSGTMSPMEPVERSLELTRRTILGRLGLAGLGTVAASSLLSACDKNESSDSASGGGGELKTDNSVKGATDATKAANQKVLDSLPFNDKSDFDDAKRGLLERPDTLTIKNANGDVIWDLEQYKTYITDDKAAPDTVNPSLWRNAQLCMEYGLFEVLPDKIYQVRGYDLPTSPSSRVTPAGS